MECLEILTIKPDFAIGLPKRIFCNTPVGGDVVFPHIYDVQPHLGHVVVHMSLCSDVWT